MANDALFLALANAKSQPSHALRAVESAGQAGNDILGGYATGLGIKRNMQEYPLEIAGKKAALYDHMSKLAEQYGPDKATEIMSPVFQSAGLEMPTSQQPAGSTPYTPEQLTTMGPFGKNRLAAMNEAQGLAEKGPRDPASVRSNLIASGAKPEEADKWLSVNTNPQTGKVENKNYEDYIKGITAKNQGNRIDMMGGMVNIRGRGQLQHMIPSLNPASQGGIASGVQFAARQGRTLIANPNVDPQNIAAASLEFARTVLRAAPSLDAQNGANYSNNIANQFNAIAQKLTSGNYKPEDLPAIRASLNKNFVELENSSRPLIARQLGEAEKLYPELTNTPDWQQLKQDELGMNLPDIPFNPGAGSTANPNIPTGVPQYKYAKNAQGQRIRSADNWATFEPDNGNQ